MPDSYRDRKRQQAWINAEARRQVAQEQAEALTALGVPCAVRSGWVAMLDPFGLLVKLDPNGAATGWPQTAAAEATLPTVTTPATEPHSGKGVGSAAHREARRRARAWAELRRIDPPCSCPEQTYLDRVATYTTPAGVEPHAATCPRNGQLEGDRLDWLATDYPATQWPSEGGRG